LKIFLLGVLSGAAWSATERVWVSLGGLWVSFLFIEQVLPVSPGPPEENRSFPLKFSVYL
jgi:hypothetical protein